MLHFNGGVKPWTWQTNYADHKLPLCVTYLETWHLGGGERYCCFVFCWNFEWIQVGVSQNWRHPLIFVPESNYLIRDLRREGEGKGEGGD